MPIMHRRDGFEIISFHPPSEHASGQVLVFHGDGEVIVDLRPIGVREVYRMPPADVATAVALVDEYRADLIVRSGERFIPDSEGKTSGVTRTIMPHQILEQIPAARERANSAQASGVRAMAAQFDGASKRIAVEMYSGAAVAIPIAFVPGLVEATPAQCAALALTASGVGIRWPALDNDLHVPGVIERLFGLKGVA